MWQWQEVQCGLQFQTGRMSGSHWRVHTQRQLHTHSVYCTQRHWVAAEALLNGESNQSHSKWLQGSSAVGVQLQTLSTCRVQ